MLLSPGCCGWIATEVAVLFLGLVAAEVMGQSSISRGGLTIFCLYIQSQ